MRRAAAAEKLAAVNKAFENRTRELEPEMEAYMKSLEVSAILSRSLSSQKMCIHGEMVMGSRMVDRAMMLIGVSIVASAVGSFTIHFYEFGVHVITRTCML